MQGDDYLRSDFFQGHEIWLKQSQKFFEHSLPLLDQYLSSPYADEASASFALDQLIYYFKAHIKTQQSFFSFLPPIDLSKREMFPKYFALLSDMTEEAVDLLHQKMRERIKKKSSPQVLRDFYELWLECGETVYQKWLHQERFLAVFGEIMGKMF